MGNQNYQPKLKVCGLTQRSQIQELQKSGVDFLGFIFYPKSPRYVLNHLNLEQISEIKHLGKVGVFVNEDVAIVSDIAKQAHLNYIQMHGDENIEYILNLKKHLPETQIIKVFRIGQEVNTEVLKSKISEFETYADLLLFDTDSKAYGGTGETFNWSVLDQLDLQKPYLLSGGISSENIASIKSLKTKPFALDINSKFENSPGDKNLDKIQEFIQHIQHL
ncbi:phosphoribosylanthranilate isomerase [Elizabethkingia miricola]|uniref:N-(5'-phosphoribosyl)anthranilate isomerase n=1 Tax=Elizabethkingia miricola TaxID=172045 RepID=A0ABD4DPT3_ELIMR|nr:MULTISPECIES: phosphoribosylanthranilate isomerase [Elizabethkingia]KUY20942.1 phosphoribosylanthranilate isomerase [Elizabethkingia miricola]MCL1654195.1 phosphoribosylanthranilate isomerase [Elizabethkingia miricola]OPC70675.1 phosphoribosylanthranilate isomerase [Elizabethkingia miricola]OPC74683.1 phosphoribosylanthranilate isomerase [Elizabethkingia miricola]QCO44903.1 phosphoribosylanthranilate isomerase [Elizabethkingia sp. 2-6]